MQHAVENSLIVDPASPKSKTPFHPVFRILVTDFDSCLHTPSLLSNNGFFILPNTNNRFLSPHLINQAKNGNYVYWKGCSHRCLGTMKRKKFTDTLTDKVAASGHGGDPANTLTVRIVENFTALTGLPNRGVSTLDDLSESALKRPLHEQCGLGFEHILKPAELAAIAAPKDAKGHYSFADIERGEHVDLDDKSWHIESRTKNKQLIQVINQAKFEITEMAKEIYGPDVEPILEVDYFEDIAELITALTQADFKAALPANVRLQGFLHYEIKQIKVTPYSSRLEKELADPQNPLAVIDTVDSKITPDQCVVINKESHAALVKNKLITSLSMRHLHASKRVESDSSTYTIAKLQGLTLNTNDSAADGGSDTKHAPKTLQTPATGNAAQLAAGYAAPLVSAAAGAAPQNESVMQNAQLQPSKMPG